MKSMIIILLLMLYTVTGANDVRIKNTEVENFIQEVLPDALHISKECGIPLELILAQTCLETGYGTSNLCKQHCNYMGIKYRGKYAVYTSLSECLHKYSQVLNQACYRSLNPNSLTDWLDALESCNYAMSTKYRYKLNWIIRKFHLDQL